MLISSESDQRAVKMIELVSPNLYFVEGRKKQDIHRTLIVNQDSLHVEIGDDSRDDQGIIM